MEIKKGRIVLYDTRTHFFHSCLKAVLIGILSLSFVSISSFSYSTNRNEIIGKYVQAIFDFWKGKITDSQRHDKAWLTKCVGLTDKWMQRFGIEDYDSILLTIFDRESGFNLDSTNTTLNGEPVTPSIGISQINTTEITVYDTILKKHEFTVPSDPLEKNIAEGVAAFYCKLGDAKGNVVDAIRRYNGSGVHAEFYKKTVAKFHKLIFRKSVYKIMKKSKIKYVSKFSS